MHKNSPLQMFYWKYNTLNAIQLPLNSEVSNVFLRFIINLQGLFCLFYEKHASKRLSFHKSLIKNVYKLIKLIRD